MKNNIIKVDLKLIVEAIEMASDEWRQYLDIEKMEIVSLPEYPYMGENNEDDERLSELIEEGWRTRFFGLPTPYDIHEYSIMEQFIWDLPKGRMQESLERAICGKGAFRRFKEGIYRYGIEQKWYDYQQEAYRKIAREWCEEYGFEYDKRECGTKNAAEGIIVDPDSLRWQEVHTDHIIQDEWIDFRSSTFRFPDGREVGPFYTYTRKDYVVIVASDTNGNYICVNQFRQGIQQITTEFPAGGVEVIDTNERMEAQKHGSHGSQKAESDALAAAKRELQEETGYVSDEWSHLLTIPVDATLTDNYAHLYMAKNCRKVSGQSLDELEFIHVTTYTAEKVEQLIQKGEFQQAMHVMAWLLSSR